MTIVFILETNHRPLSAMHRMLQLRSLFLKTFLFFYFISVILFLHEILSLFHIIFDYFRDKAEATSSAQSAEQIEVLMKSFDDQAAGYVS